jgi:aspartate/methionine/tyrosine aminotransferase
MRSAIESLPASRIREVSNAGIGRSDVLAFWFGESDEATPAHVGAAAIRSIAEGETFYAHNFGLPELREAIAAYVSELHCAAGRRLAALVLRHARPEPAQRRGAKVEARAASIIARSSLRKASRAGTAPVGFTGDRK